MQGNTFFTRAFSLSSSSVLIGFAFLSPLLFFPFITEMFDQSKWFIAIVVALVFVIGFAVSSLLRRRLEVSRSPLTIGFLTLGIVTAISIFVSSPNKTFALVGSGMFLIALSLLFITGSSLIRARITNSLILALGSSAVLISVISALERLGVSLESLAGLSGTASGLFPNGGPLVNTVVLTVIFAIMITFVFTQKSTMMRVVGITFSTIALLGLVLNLFLILPGKPQAPVFLGYAESWSVALDVLKNPKTALIGVGPEQYVQAFSLFKPVNINQGPYWFVRFTGAHNFPLDLIVTHGILGIGALILIALGVLNLVRHTRKEELPLLVGVCVIIAFLLLFPASPVILMLLVILLIALQSAQVVSSQSEGTPSYFTLLTAHSSTNRDEKHVTTGVIALICGVLVVLAIAGLYLNTRHMIARAVYSQGTKAIRANDAKTAYDLTRQSILVAPYMEDARRSFALINLTIAQGMTQDKDLSEEDKKTAIQLVQQSISEGKAAVALNPTDALNWQTLATVYNALIGSSKDAPNWTVAAYAQAIVRSPADPTLRFNLAAVFRRAGNLDQAQRFFEQAAQLKPDYANAYFNLADVAKAQDKKEQQLTYLSKTLSLIKTSDEGYGKLKEQVDALTQELGDKAKAIQAEQQAKTATVSATPRPAASPAPSQKLETVTTATSSGRTQVDLPNDSGVASPSAIPDVPQE
jgi:tetratricopeptide (TPR) repeat protein